MSIRFRFIIFILMLVCSQVMKAAGETPGHIRGTLLLDDTWERTIYMSYIETFEKKFTVSNDIIIAGSEVDSSGNFEISLEKLPSGWSLLRLHVVKKGVSPASLIIGSADENYFFIIVSRSSEIDLHNAPGKPVFKKVSISGAPYMSTFEYITNLSDYPNSINYENSLIEKEFIEEVINEKLKVVADTCKNPLVSLYALYQTDFYSGYKKYPEFYKNYLSGWRNEKSLYFEAFRRQFPVSENHAWLYILIFFSSAVLIFIIFYIKDRTRRRLRKLSVQERKIFELLQKGASNQEISNEFNIELSTVKSHVSSIFSKLNIKSRTEALNIKNR